MMWRRSLRRPGLAACRPAASLARLPALPGLGGEAEDLDLDAAALQRAGEDVGAGRGDRDRPAAHRAGIVEQQRHHRVAELGVALLLEGERLHRVDDDARQARGSSTPSSRSKSQERFCCAIRRRCRRLASRDGALHAPCRAGLVELLVEIGAQAVSPSPSASSQSALLGALGSSGSALSSPSSLSSSERRGSRGRAAKRAGRRRRAGQPVEVVAGALLDPRRQRSTSFLPSDAGGALPVSRSRTISATASSSGASARSVTSWSCRGGSAPPAWRRGCRRRRPCGWRRAPRRAPARRRRRRRGRSCRLGRVLAVDGGSWQARRSASESPRPRVTATSVAVILRGGSGSRALSRQRRPVLTALSGSSSPKARW
jgi:hypothetical protein